MTTSLVQGDCRALLPELPPGSVDCVVTSPPYYQQRDYGHPDQIGLEGSAIAYVEALVAVFRLVRDALHPEGTVFLNLGDTFNAYNGNRGKSTSFSAKVEHDLPRLPSGYGLTDKGARNKSLLGVPWRAALGLIDDGWIVRSEIVWEKARPKPERSRDRPARAHETVFLLAKSERYRWFGEPGRSVWSLPSVGQGGAHSAKMALALAVKCLSHGCPPGGLALDPFAGSGTTLKAAESLGMRAIGFDLRAPYCQHEC